MFKKIRCISVDKSQFASSIWAHRCTRIERKKVSAQKDWMLRDGRVRLCWWRLSPARPASASSLTSEVFRVASSPVSSKLAASGGKAQIESTAASRVVVKKVVMDLVWVVHYSGFRNRTRSRWDSQIRSSFVSAAPGIAQFLLVFFRISVATLSHYDIFSSCLRNFLIYIKISSNFYQCANRCGCITPTEAEDYARAQSLKTYRKPAHNVVLLSLAGGECPGRCDCTVMDGPYRLP